GSYVPERLNFGTITRDSSGTFVVVTKAGETRYYGQQGSNRLNGANSETAVWLLERVVDEWGNYFVIHYNHDNGNNIFQLTETYAASGIWVSEIDYTGSIAAVPTQTFTAVTFSYSPRDDWRWTRYGNLRIPQNQLLTSIATAAGTYSLTYDKNELQTIGY